MRLVLAGLVLLVGALSALGLRQARAARRARRAVGALADRLELGQPAPPGGGDMEAVLARVRRAADAALGRAVAAEGLGAALAGVLEAVPLGVVVAGPDGEIVFRNQAAAELVGTRPSDVLAARAVSELLAVAAAGESDARTLDLYGPPRRTLSLSAVPLGANAAVVVEDVSDRRRLDAVRRDFVANVSHELKTPVAALGLLAETLAAEEDLGVVRRLAERMQEEAFRVARIIEDLLDLSRLEAEAGARHERVHVNAVVGEAVEQVRPSASLRDVRIAQEEVPRSWTVVGEHRQLVSALANLLENAVKYSDEGSSVEVRARTDGRVIDLLVADHGIGIPARELDRIFERFYRVDRGRGRDSGGTGLGLSIVRHVAANHGGEVVVESHEGEGSVFTLRLPAEPGPVGVVAEAG